MTEAAAGQVRELRAPLQAGDGPGMPGSGESTDQPLFDENTLRAGFSTFPSGVVAVCAEVDGAPVGLSVSSFVGVSLGPALVGFCVRTESSTWPVLRSSPRLGISVLGEQQQAVAQRLSSRSADRFAGVMTSPSTGGALAIDGSSAFFNTSIEREIDAGDHQLVLLRVHSLRCRPSLYPLVFHASAFRHVSKPAG